MHAVPWLQMPESTISDCYSLTFKIIWVGITLQVYKSLVDDGGMVAVVALR